MPAFPPLPNSPSRPRPQGGVSIGAVAERAGVSIATVSRVMNGVAHKASAETAERVLKAVAELGYRPGSVGRALRARQSRLVALLVANLANPAMAAIAASVETALRAQGLVMVVCDTCDRPEIQDEYLLEMRAQLVRATVLLGAVASEQLAAMTRDGETLLFVNRRNPDAEESPFVGIDNRRAGREVAAWFVSQNIEVAGVIHGSLDSSATADRVTAFLAALEAQGQALPDSRVRTIATRDHLRIGHELAPILMALDQSAGGTRRRGLFCSSDLIAYGAHCALAAQGMRIPEDFVLVGFDDNPLNDWIAPWLTSVRVPYEDFGAAVVAALHAIWAGQPVGATLLAHHLAVRGG